MRTMQALFVTRTLLRLLQFRLEQAEADTQCLHLPWNKHKRGFQSSSEQQVIGSFGVVVSQVLTLAGKLSHPVLTA